MTPIYLDSNSTTPLRPEAWEAMRAPLTEAYGNPASAHAPGRRARRFLEAARERVAALLGAAPDEVLFTSGATEANNLALFGLAAAWPAGSRTAAAPFEHPCVVEPLTQLAGRGVAVDWLPVSRLGHVEPAAVLGALTPATRLVALMLVNHETGCVQPVRELAESLPPGVALHCDAAQAVGKMPVSLRDLGATTLSLSGHKFGAPKGVGALLVRKGTELRPQLFGGHQQQGRRPGTEPVALAVGLAAALEVSVREIASDHARLVTLHARLLARLEAGAAPVVVNGGGLPTTLNVAFPGCRAELLLASLDLAGVACSAGSACSSGSLLPSPVLRAMRVPEEVLRSSLRLSLAATLTEAEIDDAAGRVVAAVRNLRAAPGAT